jgi:hypothetical protein
MQKKYYLCSPKFFEVKKATVFIIIFIAILHTGGGFLTKSCIDFYTCNSAYYEEELHSKDEGRYTRVDNNVETVAVLHISCNLNSALQRNVVGSKFQNLLQIIHRFQQYRKTILIDIGLKNILFASNPIHAKFPCQYYIFGLRKIII